MELVDKDYVQTAVCIEGRNSEEMWSATATRCLT